jgi:universal stress protein E
VIFGSTGLKLLRLSPGAVWLVKPREDDNDSTDIIAATDGGNVGADVIVTAVPLAKSLNARLHIVHAVEGEAGTSEALPQAEALVHQQLANTDYRTLPFGVKLHIKSGSPDQCILDAVKEVNADLVVLGTSSRTGVSGLLPGSTVERLLPELPCSVMAIKPEGFRSILPADFWTH